MDMRFLYRQMDERLITFTRIRIDQYPYTHTRQQPPETDGIETSLGNTRRYNHWNNGFFFWNG